MKLKSLRIKNFQSIKDMTIDFSERGVTRFSGPNNIGKSVILKAISSLVLNVSNRNYKEYIRDDEDTFEVRMEDFKGNWVHLSRGAVDFYRWNIEGKEGRLDRTGGKVPLEVKKYFNLYIEEEKTGECLNIRLPGDLLLYVDTSAGDNAMMFQKALGTEEYMLGIKEVDKTGRKLTKEVKLVEKYLEQEEIKLSEAQTELVQVQKTVEDIERYESVLVVEIEKYRDIEHVETEVVEYAKLNRTVKENRELLNTILDGTDEDSKGLNGLGEDLSTLGEIEKYYESKEEYDLLYKDLTTRQEQVNNFNSIDIEEDIKVFGVVEKVVKDLEDIEQLEEKLSMYDIKEVSETETGIQTDIDLASLVGTVLSEGTLVSTLRKGIKDKVKQKEELSKELASMEEELGYCPTCGSTFPHEH